ncbi:MAG: alpha/beta hydrolase [Gemmataceae bacterium]|nr:alpha/beta hydrolase [Gemmataceae bacterium]
MSKTLLSAALLALVIPTLLPWTGRAQPDDKGEKVRIPTVDGVDLHAKFYRCRDGKIKNPPMVLMLHALGENSAKKPWVALAEKLSEKSAVMTFDFRGHGQSTEIEPEQFWNVLFNRKNVRDAAKAVASGKSTIEFKDFLPPYYPAFVNDIAACKAYLDRRNDTGDCNTSSFILVGAEDGATLGAIWLNSEYHRHRLVQNPINLAMIAEERPEGLDVIGCVWLSIKPQLGSRPVAVANTLAIPLKLRAVPMVFMFGEEDAKSRAVAQAALSFKTARVKSKYAFTDAVKVPRTKLAGMGLLQPSLNVDGAIYQYLFGGKDAEGVVEAKSREWTERDFRKTQYIWRIPGTPAGATGTPAKLLNDTNFIFNDYARYMRSQ